MHGLVADRGEEPGPDTQAPEVPPDKHVAFHDSMLAGRVRPAESGGDRGRVRRFDEPGVIAELRRQTTREGDIGSGWLRHAIRPALRRDWRLDRVQRRQFLIRPGSEADATNVEGSRRGHGHQSSGEPELRSTEIRRLRRLCIRAQAATPAFAAATAARPSGCRRDHVSGLLGRAAAGINSDGADLVPFEGFAGRNRLVRYGTQVSR